MCGWVTRDACDGKCVNHHHNNNNNNNNNNRRRRPHRLDPATTPYIRVRVRGQAALTSDRRQCRGRETLPCDV